MKYILVLFLLTSCSSVKKTAFIPDVDRDISQYEVSKIDSLNNYYIIYLKRSDSLFKLVSKKEPAINCQKIESKHPYSFELVSIWNQPIIINGVDWSLAATPHVNCIGLDEATNVCLERSLGINDIFYAKNLTGLCIVKVNTN